MAQVSCAAGELNRIMKGPDVDKDRALTVRQELARLWTEMIRLQMAAVDTPGELGTLANLEQQSRGAAHLLDQHDAALEKMLGTTLPPACTPSTRYVGPPRLIVPTVRSIVDSGESLGLKILVLDEQPVKSLAVQIRPLGGGPWQAVHVRHLARAVYSATFPSAKADFEYYVVGLTASGEKLVWPATAPDLNQTVVVWQQAK